MNDAMDFYALSLRGLSRRAGFRPVAYAGAHHVPYELLSKLFPGGKKRQAPGDEDGVPRQPIAERPMAGLPLGKKAAAFIECCGLTKMPPFSFLGWSLGVLARVI